MLSTISQTLRALIDSICEDRQLNEHHAHKFRDIISGFLGAAQDQVAFVILSAIQTNATSDDQSFNDIWIKIEMGDIKISHINRAVFDFLIMASLEVEDVETNFQALIEEYLATDRTNADTKKAASKINSHFHSLRKFMSEDYDRLRRLSQLSQRVRSDIKTKTLDQCIIDNWMIAQPDEPVKFWLFAEAVLIIVVNVEDTQKVSLDSMMGQNVVQSHQASNDNQGTAEHEFLQENPFNRMHQSNERNSLKLSLEALQSSNFRGFTAELKNKLEVTFPMAEQALSIPLTLARILCLQPLQNKFIQADRLKHGPQKIAEIIETSCIDGYETLPDFIDALNNRLGELPLACQFAVASEEDNATEQQKNAGLAAFENTKKSLKSKINEDELRIQLQNLSGDMANLYSFITTLEQALKSLPQIGIDDQFRTDRAKFIERCTVSFDEQSAVKG